MKKVFFILTASILLTLLACKKEINKSAVVIMDCTGTYLRHNGKDYKVCNLEKVTSYQDGEKVTATFKKIDECNGSGNFVFGCEMLHNYEAWIEVIKIK